MGGNSSVIPYPEKATVPHPGPGRPPTRPWERFEVVATIWWIDNWHSIALWLAQQDAVPEAAFRGIMARERVPPELWDEMRAVIGRHLRFVPRLTPREQSRLGELALEQKKRPGEEWSETEEDKKLAKEFARLREKLHGRKTAREIDLSLTRGSAASSVARVIVPRRLKVLWLAFDTWGARQFDVRVKTFRDWRRWAVAADSLLPEEKQLLRSLRRPEAPTAVRHRAR